MNSMLPLKAMLNRPSFQAETGVDVKMRNFPMMALLTLTGTSKSAQNDKSTHPGALLAKVSGFKLVDLTVK